MNTKHNQSERGQAIVFLVIGFVVFLGFVALAIDGGMAYSDRRYAQNSSDAASLAGGGEAALYLENQHVFYQDWDCGLTDIQNAMILAENKAVERAANNNFSIDHDPSDSNGVTTVCGVENHGWIDRFIDVTVVISDTTQTSFAHLLFPNALINNVDAVTRVRPRMPLAYGNAIVALNQADCQGNQNGAIFGGSGETHINGGGVWSNGCLRGDGSNYNVVVDNGSINYVGEEDGTMNFTPTQQQQPAPIPPSAYSVPAPNCNDPAAHNLTNGNELIRDDLEGLYCVDDDIRFNANDVVKSDPSGLGVTIYVLPGHSVSINGGATINLNSPANDPDPSPAMVGVLLYVANGDASIEGGSDSAYLGLIYVPNGNIFISGASGTNPTFNTQLIGRNVTVTGNASIDINFDASQQYQKPTWIELYR